MKFDEIHESMYDEIDIHSDDDVERALDIRDRVRDMNAELNRNFEINFYN